MIALFKKPHSFYLIAILILGGLLRFNNLNWDQGFHLHPDERFLTMVGNAMKLPNTFFEYFDPKTSPFNPANIGYTFFVYGTLPLILNKSLAIFSQNDTYDNFTLQGRFLSGFVDLMIIIFLFKTVELLEKHHNLHKNIKYFASFFYAIAVLPIQLSHFFAVDTFLNFFIFASFYFILRYYFYGNSTNVIASAAFFGFAIASKITASFIFPLLVFLLTRISLKTPPRSHFVTPRGWPEGLPRGELVRSILLYLIVAYGVLRLADPYLFETNNLVNPMLNRSFLANVAQLKSWEGKEVWYPPAVQWISKQRVLFSLINLAVFGLGIPSFVVALIGLWQFLKQFWRTTLLAIPLWVLLFFLFQSLQFAQAMRYFIFLYPFFAIFAGFGLYYVINYVIHYVTRPGRYAISFTLFALVLVWSVSFMSIYTNKHSRVTASEWIYQHLEDQSTILGEHWDDPLPLSVTNTYQKTFTVKLLPVFDQDTPEKWKTMHELLDQGNYLILSSNRGWGSIPTVPDKYPLMSKFYKDLFAGKLQYKKLKEFTSYPVIPDDWADESFTVYDHPKIMIFKKILF